MSAVVLALVFLAGCWCGVVVAFAVFALCQVAGRPRLRTFARELDEIRRLPEVRHG